MTGRASSLGPSRSDGSDYAPSHHQNDANRRADQDDGLYPAEDMAKPLRVLTDTVAKTESDSNSVRYIDRGA